MTGPTTAMPMPCEVPGRARRYRRGDSDQRPGHFRSKPAEGEDAGHDHYRDNHGRQVDVRQGAEDLEELHNGSAGPNLHADHLAQHRNTDLKSDTGEKSHQHSLREEVSQESQSQDACQQ